MTAPKWIAEEVERLDEEADEQLALVVRWRWVRRLCAAASMASGVGSACLFAPNTVVYAVVLAIVTYVWICATVRASRSHDRHLAGHWLRTGLMQGIVRTFHRRPSVIARAPFHTMRTEAPN